MQDLPRHQCLIYEGSPARYLSDIALIMSQNLEANRRCLYLNSPPMVAGVRSYLAAAGVDVAQAMARGSLVLSSGRDHLVNDEFVPERMLKMLEESVLQALHDGFTGLWATGDMMWEFGGKNDFSRLLDYEWGLEDVFQKHPELSGICQYYVDNLPPLAVCEGLQSHAAVCINSTLSRLNPYYAGHRPPWWSRTIEAPISGLLSRLRDPADS